MEISAMGVEICTVKYLGEDFAGSNRYTRFWIKKDGVWKVAAGIRVR